jgi:hypothetical protein
MRMSRLAPIRAERNLPALISRYSNFALHFATGQDSLMVSQGETGCSLATATTCAFAELLTVGEVTLDVGTAEEAPTGRGPHEGQPALVGPEPDGLRRDAGQPGDLGREKEFISILHDPCSVGCPMIYIKCC